MRKINIFQPLGDKSYKLRDNYKLPVIVEMLLNHTSIKQIKSNPTVLQWIEIDGYNDKNVRESDGSDGSDDKNKNEKGKNVDNDNHANYNTDRKTSSPSSPSSPSCNNSIEQNTNTKIGLSNQIDEENRRSNNSSSSSSSGSGIGEGIPYAEMFSTEDNVLSLPPKNRGGGEGTQLKRSLQNINDPEPNEEANLRGQNMIIKKTITEYPESGRRVVKTFDE